MGVNRALLCAAAIAVVTAGCSSGAGGSGVPAGTQPAESVAAVVRQPMTQAGAQAAAKDGYDTYASGDYGGWWDVWTPAAQQVISRTEYLRLMRLCGSIAEGTPFVIQKVTVTGSSAAVRWERAGLLIQSDTWSYSAGMWRYQPPAEALADYRLGADRAAAKRRAAGSCK